MKLALNKRLYRFLSLLLTSLLLVYLVYVNSTRTVAKLANAAIKAASDLKSSLTETSGNVEKYVLTDIVFETCTSIAFFESCTHNLNAALARLERSSLDNAEEFWQAVNIQKVGKDLRGHDSFFTTVYAYKLKLPLNFAKEFKIPVIEDLYIYHESDDYKNNRNIPEEIYLETHETKDIKTLTSLKYYNAGYGLWYKKSDSYNNKKLLADINFVFGPRSIYQPNWKYSSKYPLNLRKPDKSSEGLITDFSNYKEFNYHVFDQQVYVVDKPLNSKSNPKKPVLQLNLNDKFKIVQLADLHMSTGLGKCQDMFPEIDYPKSNCLADILTEKLVNEVLDLEKPDLVIYTGDQVFGPESYIDAETSLFKALQPVLKRNIPFAMVFGNHDDEDASLSRQELMDIIEKMPLSLAVPGPSDISGVGNYRVLINDNSLTELPLVSLYLLDSHSYAPGDIEGYDWIKQEQLDYVQSLHHETPTSLSLAFFHIPLVDYQKVSRLNEDYIQGTYKEGIMSSAKDSGVFDVLKQVNTKFVSVGHDHVNDFCFDNEGVALCYGGGGGFGGYAGYNGYKRRIRTIEIDYSADKLVKINTWKRIFDDVNTIVDFHSYEHSK